MHALEFVVVLGSTILVGEFIARRSPPSASIVLLALGSALGFLPAMRDVHLPPELMLLLFLPVLLYWESLNTSLREIRASLRGVVLVSTLLVALTAAVVAVVAHWFGLTWGAAWVLGAAIAPTDATAVAVLAKGLPLRARTTLRAESLINDGTALVIYGIAVSAVVTGTAVTLGAVTWQFVFAYCAGAAIGLAVGWLGTQARLRISDPLQMNVLILLLPFSSFLLAELIEASGVIAVVACGLLMSQTGPRVGIAAQRQQMAGTWSFATYLINATLFVLIGIELNAAARSLTSDQVMIAIAGSVAVAVAIMLIRFAFLFVSAHVIRLIDRRPSQLARRVTNRARVVSTLAGFRGAVTLAAAIAVPATLNSGAPFPDRELIVSIAAGVITITIVVQGSLLGWAVKWAQLPEDTLEEELRMAQRLSAQSALEVLPQVAADLDVASSIAEKVEREYRERITVLEAIEHSDPEVDQLLKNDDVESRLRLALIETKRATMIDLRDRREIDDTVLRRLQMHLDIEEARLGRAQPTDA